MKHTARAHYIAKACVPLQRIDSFENNGWLPERTIDWIERAYPSEVENLFIETEAVSKIPETEVNDDYDDDDDGNVDDYFSDEEDNAI